MAATIQARVFQCASEIVGGEVQLSERLGVRQGELSRWLANQETSPLPAFFGAVDIILASEEGFAAIFTSRVATLHQQDREVCATREQRNAPGGCE